MASYEEIKNSFMEVVKKWSDENCVNILKQQWDSFDACASDKRQTLDQVFRDHLLEMLSHERSDVQEWENFVLMCICACREDMCTPTMPVVLLGDVFDVITLHQCEKLFEFVESGVNTWREEMFFNACKNNLLRLCNDLLRRLSRSQNTVFCGRILLFLAKFFPFSERSGLNIVSEFNVDNITEFGGESGCDLKDVLLDTDDIAEDDVKSDSKFKIDYNLYCKFWALQDFFRNPNQCYNKMHWKTFAAHSSNVLSAFNSFKLEEVEGKQRRKALPQADIEEKQHYFAKFLTNQKLLELELSDSNFRRYVLVQFLIVFQYLNSPVKFKSESHELKAEQVEWVKETTILVYNLLAETPPDGPAFVEAVKHLLKREEHWNAWKNDGCPEFGKKANTPNSDEVIDEPIEKRKATPRKKGKRHLGDIMREASAQGKFYMGNPELTKLWNMCPDNLEACKSKDRDFLPSLETYFEEAMEQTDPAAMVEDQYKRVNDGNFGWRALRLLARRSPYFFTHSNNPINKLPEYLESMIKKIAKDRPSTQMSDEMTLRTEEEQPTLKEDTEMEADEEDDELLKGSAEDDNNGSQRKTFALTSEQISSVASLINEGWKKLASKLGYRADEIDYFTSEYSSDTERARNMLQIWAGDDVDASPENLSYTLEGLGMIEAAEVLKDI